LSRLYGALASVRDSALTSLVETLEEEPDYGTHHIYGQLPSAASTAFDKFAMTGKMR
jgi:hypothetical protein